MSPIVTLNNSGAQAKVWAGVVGLAGFAWGVAR